MAEEVEEAGPAPVDYGSLLSFRIGLRRFLQWSEEQAREVGLTPAQHQLLLAIKGHPGDHSPTVGDLAEYLLLRHHSTVELIDRAESSGLVQRSRDPADARVIRIRLTPTAEGRLFQLSAVHLTELRRLAPILAHLVASETAAQSLAGSGMARGTIAVTAASPAKEAPRCVCPAASAVCCGQSPRNFARKSQLSPSC